MEINIERHRKSSPRNQNITVRVSSDEKKHFEKLAALNYTNVSGWAYDILKTNKHGYGKAENIDDLLKVLDDIINTSNNIKKKV
ncbi:MAG TPA: hypothetical protein VKN14_00675 [Flavobacteriaceae bacterium]|nr:hypothetical protein [Flavobacteriaceae bacterium]